MQQGVERHAAAGLDAHRRRPVLGHHGAGADRHSDAPVQVGRALEGDDRRGDFRRARLRNLRIRLLAIQELPRSIVDDGDMNGRRFRRRRIAHPQRGGGQHGRRRARRRDPGRNAARLDGRRIYPGLLGGVLPVTRKVHLDAAVAERPERLHVGVARGQRHALAGARVSARPQRHVAHGAQPLRQAEPRVECNGRVNLIGALCRRSARRGGWHTLERHHLERGLGGQKPARFRARLAGYLHLRSGRGGDCAGQCGADDCQRARVGSNASWNELPHGQGARVPARTVLRRARPDPKHIKAAIAG